MKRTLLTGLLIITAAAIVSRMWHLESQAVADKPSLVAQSHQESGQYNPFATIETTITPAGKMTRRVNITVYVPTLRDKVVVYVPKVRQVVVEVSETERRSQAYSDLMLQKAQRMTEGELDEAIDEVKAELEAQNEDAQAELQQAIDILERIVETSAGTPAAKRARFALQVLRSPLPKSQPVSQPASFGLEES